MIRSRRPYNIGNGRSVGVREGLLRRTLYEYSQNSGIHGMRYLGEQHRPWTERLWWTLATVTSFLCIAYLIANAWQKWTQTPVLVSFADRLSPVWNIPFPTITVCPSNKYVKRAFDMSKTWRVGRMNLTENERRLSDDLMLVCHSMGEHSKNLTDYNYLSDESTVQNILKVAPAKFDSVECITMDDTCEWIVSTMLTREGVCYSYNALPNMSLYRQEHDTTRQVWSLENGYLDKVEPTALPVRAKGAGYPEGILLGLKTNSSELDYTCKPQQGFRITLTSPADFPRPYQTFYWVPLTGMTQMIITPHVTETDDTLRGYLPQQRQCYFQSERRLSHFSTYTQDNCEFECLVNHTLRTCRCVDYYMPHNKSTPVCGYGAVNCMYHAERNLSRNLMDRINGQDTDLSCNCLPSCQTITFSAEISQGNIDFDEIKNYLALDPEKYRNVTANFVYVFLASSEFLPLRRSELYGVTSFIAVCGGLLGLCCGFSLLSLAELLYFFTLRLWNNAEKDATDRIERFKAPIPNKGWLQGFVH